MSGRYYHVVIDYRDPDGRQFDRLLSFFTNTPEDAALQAAHCVVPAREQANGWYVSKARVWATEPMPITFMSVPEHEARPVWRIADA